jgi:hypothetical protein
MAISRRESSVCTRYDIIVRRVFVLVSPSHGPSDLGNDHLLTLKAWGRIGAGLIIALRRSSGLALLVKVGSLNGAGLPLNDQ